MESGLGLEETLSGPVERVIFHAPDTGFAVLRVRPVGRRESVAVVGRIGAVTAGETIEATGVWRNDPNHGPQFQAREIKAAAPEGAAGIEAVLGSGAFPGVGRATARKLILAFGEEVFDVIERAPARLSRVAGITSAKAKAIAEVWGEQKSAREAMVFLQGHGLGPAQAAAIYKAWGAATPARVRADPYALAREIKGIGFASADALAQKLGVAPDSPQRIGAGLWRVLEEALGDGHCALPRAEATERAAHLLGVDQTKIEEIAAQEIAEKRVILDRIGEEPCLFQPWLYATERGISRRLKDLAAGAPPWSARGLALSPEEAAARSGMKLEASQLAALRLALSSKVMLLTGGPGVGKTTLTNALLRMLEPHGLTLKLCAPTGRASKRLSETTGLTATTIHRLLETTGVGGGFQRDADNPIECDLLVVDESSMIDAPLMHALLKATPPEAAVLFVGDADQLPPVGPGQPFADMIRSEALPTARLTEVFRQAAESKIVRAAHAINRGEVPDLTRPEGDSDFYFIPAEDPETAVQRVVEVTRDHIPRRFGFDPLREIQILTPMNRGSLGAKSLNLALQAALNPNPPAKVERFGTVFGVGDRVMQTENDHEREVYNGDLGFIEEIDPEAESLRIRFDGRRVELGFEALEKLALAYAVTIHKSQGSEYPAVLVVLANQHYVMLRRNLLYTAVTRGRRLAAIIGQARAVETAVRQTEGTRRWSRLTEWLGSPEG